MIERHLKVAFYQGQSGPNKMPASSGVLSMKMPPGGGVFTDRDPKGSGVLLSTPPKPQGGSLETPKPTEHIKQGKNGKCIKIEPPNHEIDPNHTKSDFCVKVLRFSKMKGKEEEGSCTKIKGVI